MHPLERAFQRDLKPVMQKIIGDKGHFCVEIVHRSVSTGAITVDQLNLFQVATGATQPEHNGIVIQPMGILGHWYVQDGLFVHGLSFHSA